MPLKKGAGTERAPFSPRNAADLSHGASPLSQLLLLIPAQLMFVDSGVNSRGSGLPLVALRLLAMQASTTLSKLHLLPHA
jgi:hypothetical protein